MANSLWWFDSKFEPSPVAPPTVNDNYTLVQSSDVLVDALGMAGDQPILLEGDHLAAARWQPGSSAR